MIRIDNLVFNEDEKIKLDDILRCHPQMIASEEELIGVPLRCTIGFQCIYDKAHREYQALTFYAPAEYSRIAEDNKMSLLGPPIKSLSYVLASYDGTLTTYKDGLCLVSDGKTLIYTDLNIIKSSGNVKKGAIIGTVKFIDNKYGYGVTLRGYKGGQIWNIPNDIINIRCIE